MHKIPSYDVCKGMDEHPKLSYGIPYGQVKITKQGYDIWIDMSMYNLAKHCPKSKTKKGGCGIHIHQGTDCHNPGDHYWNKDIFGSNDPWSAVMYDSDKHGHADTAETGSIAMPFGNGFSFKHNVGHVIVMHSFNGEKIACGVLK